MKNKPYPKAKFELRPSKIIPGEVGLFAIKEFTPGEVVIEESYWDQRRLITWDEFEKIDPLTKRQLIYFCYKDEKGVHAPLDINKINIAYFVNHSCGPNLYCPDEKNYVAQRKININDELTIDVEALMEKHVFSFECHCGSKNCRKIVKI
jgi:SET domain-containing protein